jgi:hypothetical protein
VPLGGDIKIVSTLAAGTCTPLTYNGGIIDSTVGFGTHLQTSGGTAAGTFITETLIPAIPLTVLAGPEGTFLPQACQFARYLGSGKGVCTCS